MEGYRQNLDEWVTFTGDKAVNAVDAQAIRAFLICLRTEHKSHRFGFEGGSLSDKTIRNYWVSLKAFCAWYSREFNVVSPMANVTAPHFTKVEVEPFKEAEVRVAESLQIQERSSDRCSAALHDVAANGLAG